jgi:hypothetical protein
LEADDELDVDGAAAALDEDDAAGAGAAVELLPDVVLAPQAPVAAIAAMDRPLRKARRVTAP